MNKTQIQNNPRKLQSSYLKTEFNFSSSIKDVRYPTDPSPNKNNKENYNKPSFLKSTLQNHLIKTDRIATPTIPKTSIVNIFLKQKHDTYFQQSEQQTEIKLNGCQNHKKRLKYEVEEQMVCSRCAIEYAIQQGVRIQIADSERKMLTFGQDEEQEAYHQLAMNIGKEMQFLNSIQTQGDGNIKKRDLKEFIVKIGDVIGKNLQYVKQLQESTTQGQHFKQQFNKLQDELQGLCKNIISDLVNKQQLNSQSALVNDGGRQSNINQIKQTLNSQIADLQNIKKDIMENLENIILQMDVAPFKIIINKYNEKIRLFEDSLQEIQEKTTVWPDQQQEDNSPTIKKVRDPNFRKKLSKIMSEIFEIPHQSQQLEQFNNNAKFLQLLQKVNKNQNSNSMFYQSLLKDFQPEDRPKQQYNKYKQQD